MTPRSKTLKEVYLSVYNAASALAWSVILYATLNDLQLYLDPDTPDQYQSNIYVSHQFSSYPHKLLVDIQLANASFEIIHAISGVVPSPVGTVLLQFAARLLLTHGISYTLPNSPGNFNFAAYISMSLAWCFSEIIRYGFYLIKLIYPDNIPYALIWIRYSAFFLLYPAGLLSESTIVYQSLQVLPKWSPYYCFLVFGLFLYVPGFVTLYAYMIKQRGKVLTRQLKFRKLA